MPLNSSPDEIRLLNCSLAETAPAPIALPYAEAHPHDAAGRWWRSAKGVFTGVCGVGIGLAALPLLYYGWANLPHLLRDDLPRRDWESDAISIIGLPLVGLICLCFAVRWCRMTMRIVRGDRRPHELRRREQVQGL